MGSSKTGRFAGNVDFRAVTYLIAIPVFLFYALAATGCISTSPGVPNLYLVAIEPSNGTNRAYQVRVGYFGLCLCSEGCVCESTIGLSAATVANDSSSQFSHLPETAGALVSIALSLQSHFFVVIVAAAGVFFLIGIVSLLLSKRELGKRSRAGRNLFLKRLTLSNLWISVALAFTSAVSVSQLGPALQFISADLSGVAFSSGTVLAVLHWLIFGLSLLLSFSISLLFIKRYATGCEMQYAPGDELSSYDPESQNWPSDPWDPSGSSLPPPHPPLA